MKRNVIYHNPRCSKSRQTLALLDSKNIDIEVIEYLKQSPSKAELKFVIKTLGIKPIELIRTKEKLFSELGLSATDQKSDDEWISILVSHPILIERPIVVYNQKVAIGRPPENVLEII